MSQEQLTELQNVEEPQVEDPVLEEPQVEDSVPEDAEVEDSMPEDAEVEDPMPEEAEEQDPEDPFQVPDFMKPENKIPVEEILEEEEDFVPEEGEEGAASEGGESEETAEGPEEVSVEGSEVEPEEESDVPEKEPSQEIVFHEINRRRKTRRKKHYFLRAFMVIGILVIAVLILMSPLFDIKKIQVEGNDYYTDQQIINMSGAVKGGNIFLHTHAGRIEKRLGSNPYYTDVSVRRDLPDTLVIDLKERPQVASLKFGDDYVIIDETGYVLRLSKFMPKLTLLQGLTLSRIEVGERIDAEEKNSLRTTLDMLHTMDKGDLYFKEIQIDDLNIKAYIYDMLMVNGRPANIKKAIESGDLQKVVNRLYKSKTKRGVITVGDDDYLSFSPAF